MEASARMISSCRVCTGQRLVKVLDLGKQPLANRFLKEQHEEEAAYPLDVFLCSDCGHAELGTIVDREAIFSDYIYVSAANPTLSDHFKKYVEDVKRRVPTWRDELIVEIGSNDGILLREFGSQEGNVLGVDPAKNIQASVPTLNAFFSRETAERILMEKGRQAKVIIANNVLAHTEDIRSMVSGMATLSADDGLIVIEAPWLGDMFEHNAYDTIYHEHLSYFSITALSRLFKDFGFVLVDLEFHPVQGNSFRAFFKKEGQGAISPFAREVMRQEEEKGWTKPEAFLQLGKNIALSELKTQGKTIMGYGAPAKGNTILNYTGAGEYLTALIDDMPTKIGLFAPGSRLPVVPRTVPRPDAFVVFAWTYLPHILKKEADFTGEWIIPNRV
jgi:hypothetical protein